MKLHWGFAIAMLVGTMTPLSSWARGAAAHAGEPNALPQPLSQGYLGVDLADVDPHKAQALKLREPHGALITVIDHDAPAGQVGLRINDVVVALDGQKVETADQLRRRLREIPPGRRVSLEISRDGKLQTLRVALADRQAMEQEVWNRICASDDAFAQKAGSHSEGGSSLLGSLHLPFFGNGVNVGMVTEPLTQQMAEYLRVPNGLMVKEVISKSSAEASGLQVFDVILKVGQNAIKTQGDWERVLRANQGKTVELTVLRDRKLQTLTLLVDAKRHSLLEPPLRLEGTAAL